MTVPALVRNAYTAVARAGLAAGSGAGWAALTDEQRQSYINATGVFRSDRFGNPQPVKGKELYVLAFQNLLHTGAGPQNTWPDLVSPQPLNALSGAASVAGTSNDLTFATTPLPANMHALVYATAAKRPTIYRPSQSAYRYIAHFAPATASPFDIYAAYNAKFGIPVAGVRIFVRVVIVDARSGLASAKVDTNYIVGA